LGFVETKGSVELFCRVPAKESIYIPHIDRTRCHAVLQRGKMGVVSVDLSLKLWLAGSGLISWQLLMHKRASELKVYSLRQDTVQGAETWTAAQ
jgi:hypothetical protein